MIVSVTNERKIQAYAFLGSQLDCNNAATLLLEIDVILMIYTTILIFRLY